MSRCGADCWRANAGRRIRIELNPVDKEHLPVELRLAGSGMATPTGHALREALRRIYAYRIPHVLAIDEPERHLHPEAQRQVTRRRTETIMPTSQVIIATHAVCS